MERHRAFGSLLGRVERDTVLKFCGGYFQPLAPEMRRGERCLPRQAATHYPWCRSDKAFCAHARPDVREMGSRPDGLQVSLGQLETRYLVRDSA